MRELALFASLALGALALQKLKPKNEEEIEYAPEYFDEEKEEPAALVSGPCAEPVGKLSQRDAPLLPTAGSPSPSRPETRPASPIKPGSPQSPTHDSTSPTAPFSPNSGPASPVKPAPPSLIAPSAPLLVLPGDEFEGHRRLLARIYASRDTSTSTSASHAVPGDVNAIVPREVGKWHRKPESGYLGFLNARQRATLLHMRKRFPSYAAFHSDHDLLRFLRAREFDLAAAEALYSNYWNVYRKELFVSAAPVIRPVLGTAFDLTVFEELRPRPRDLTLRLRSLFDQFIESAVFGTDREGRPLVFQRVSNTLKRKYPERVDDAERLQLAASSQEQLRWLCHLSSAARGVYIEETCFVIDFVDVSPGGLLNFLGSKSSKKENSLNLDFFPETLGKFIIINAPFGIGALWSVLSPLLPPRTRQKIHILGGGYKKYLIEQIGKENLPSMYGGTAEFEYPAMAPLTELTLDEKARRRRQQEAGPGQRKVQANAKGAEGNGHVDVTAPAQ